MSRFHRCLGITFLMAIAEPLSAQDPSAPAAATSATVRILQGINEDSGISYSLLSVNGRLLGATTAPTPAPRLTAQCTRDAAGKLSFELLADFGSITVITYVPPWKRTDKELFAPRLQRDQVTMDFLGYTKVKPMKRQWLLLQQPAGEMKYAPPGRDSSNLEPASYYLQYLRSLPTLRLTVPNKGALEFETTAWQAKIKAEPLCKASGL